MLLSQPRLTTMIFSTIMKLIPPHCLATTTMAYWMMMMTFLEMLRTNPRRKCTNKALLKPLTRPTLRCSILSSSQPSALQALLSLSKTWHARREHRRPAFSTSTASLFLLRSLKGRPQLLQRVSWTRQRVGISRPMICLWRWSSLGDDHSRHRRCSLQPRCQLLLPGPAASTNQVKRLEAR